MNIESAGSSQRGVAFAADLLAGPVNEFIDIAVIVREQDKVLEIILQQSQSLPSTSLPVRSSTFST